jgi:hypothetical protein
VARDDRAHDGEPETRAVRGMAVRGIAEEPVEHGGTRLARDSRAVVTDGDDRAPFDRVDAHADAPCGPGELAGVLDDVSEGAVQQLFAAAHENPSGVHDRTPRPTGDDGLTARREPREVAEVHRNARQRGILRACEEQERLDENFERVKLARHRGDVLAALVIRTSRAQPLDPRVQGGERRA